MDYNFFLLKIEQLSPVDVDDLLNTALNLDYSKNNTFWNMQRHVGIDGLILPPKQSLPVLERLMNRPSFRDIFPAADRFINYEIDRLHPGGVIAEHTDSYTIKQGCALIHRLHIPLVGSANYMFRRDPTCSWTTEHMEIGSVYLFNNSVLHSVVNPNGHTRINLMLNIEDDKMESKARLYDKFNVSWRF